MCTSRYRTLPVLTFLFAALAAQPMAAADFPNRPITIVVPYATGGSGDTILRLMSASMEKSLGQPIVVEARAGGGGTIGARSVAESQPDGHTLLLGAANNFAINQFMFPRVQFDPFTALNPITKVADIPSVIFVPSALPVQTLGEFIALTKANPGRFSYASPSVGTTTHLAVEWLKQLMDIDLVHIPYRGAPPAMQALLQNEVQLYLAGWGVGQRFVESGQVRALAVASERRLPGIPLATAIESGVPGFVTSNWWGLAAPKETPKPIVDKIYDAVTKSLTDPRVVAQLELLGFLPGGLPPQRFEQTIREEAAIWEATVKRGRLAVDQ